MHSPPSRNTGNKSDFMKPTPQIEQYSEAPIDRIAARQMFKGVKEPEIGTAPSNFFSSEPIATKPSPPGFVYLVGMKRGKCVVTGFFGSIKGTSRVRHYWVTKCLCGGYELITLKTLLKPNSEHMCARCRTLDHHAWLEKNPDKKRC